MPITREDTAWSKGAYGASAPNVPGIPAFSTNQQFYIATGINDVLKMKYDGGSTTDVTLTAGYYTYTTLAAEIETRLDAAFTITSTVSYDTTSESESHSSKFTLDAGSSHTFTFIFTGSTAASTVGFDANKTAAQTLTSDSFVNGTGTITFTFSANGNDDVVTYALYSNTQSKYIGADGIADEVAEVWQTRANWNGGGAAGTVTVSGLSNYTAYTFKAKAKNELGVESAFSSNSSNMNTLPAIDYGTQSTVLTREVTTGNTKVVNTSTVYPNVDSTHLYGDVKTTVTLQNNSSTLSRLAFEYSEDSGSTYATAHHFFTIDNNNDVMNFTSDQGGPVDIDVADGDYISGAAMATALQTAMNNNATLTGTGTITFAVSFSGTTYKYTIDAGATHTIAYNNFATNVDGGLTFGFTQTHTAAQTIISDRARGSSPHALTTSAAGTAHDIYWDAYRDSGESEYKVTSVMLRFTPYDTSPSGGDAGTAVACSAFTLDNRPEQMTLINYDTFTFDKDTTPVFSSIMKPIRGGTRMFFRLKIYDNVSAFILMKSSAIDITGWEYENTTDNWVAVAVGGVSPAYANGALRVKYTIQAGNALTQGTTYSVYIEQGENRDRS